MNRPLIITIGIVILLFVVGLWVYLLAYGAPEAPREVFTNFGLFSKEPIDAEVIPVQEESQGTQLSLSAAPVQQITTRAVAGFGINSSTGEDIIRYAELGTGHIYEINLKTATEMQITLTTFPQTAEAYFSPNADYIALVTFEDGQRRVFAGKIQEELSELPMAAGNISFDDENVLFFSVSGYDGTTAYSRNLESGTQTKLFTIEIPDLKLQWGRGLENIYASTKPTRQLEGFLYEVNNGALTPVIPGAFALTAFMNNAYIVASFADEESFVSTSYGPKEELVQGLPMIEEKCVFTAPEASGVWCASAATQPDGDFIEQWYKGVVTSEDSIWYTDLDTQSAQLVADLTKLSGKTVDVTDMLLNYNGSLLLFKNKLDHSLWLYRTQ